MNDLERAARILGAARFLCVLTGAGVSAESGVPTFRGAGGYWRNRSFQELATPEAFEADPRLVWDWYLERRRTVRGCEPNAAHLALARWSRLGRGVLITQNVDGLHERAGTRGVVRFHGSLWRNRCSRCGAEREAADLEYPELPASPCCGAPERPGVVWFGEAIPEDALRAAANAVGCADAVLVVGTSGAVHPAAGIVGSARARGARAVEVNPDSTALEVDVALRLPAAEAVPAILPRE
ncbi:MAG TPA: NAD-dependent deacylase [Candidatus Saccharimonadales bacterium]|nr:NAD-dependent deacylase [Candidatus Saccharimonadales bacterium]